MKVFNVYSLVVIVCIGLVFLTRTINHDSVLYVNARDSIEPNSTSSGSWCSLTPEQLDASKQALDSHAYNITQENGTERPFNNAFWDEKREGIYVDIVSGEPLFSSQDKFNSGTGWPSFTKPILDQTVKTHTDVSLGMERIEVRSSIADSHLGHVFPDGPGPTGLRYCINSASLRFIPKEQLEAHGYGSYTYLFEDIKD